jgi:hypothetical protein
MIVDRKRMIAPRLFSILIPTRNEKLYAEWKEQYPAIWDALEYNHLYIKKMTRETVAGPWYFHLSGKYEMGEEKPEEELMGKRKSSPRLDRPYRVLSLFIVAKA